MPTKINRRRGESNFWSAPTVRFCPRCHENVTTRIFKEGGSIMHSLGSGIIHLWRDEDAEGLTADMMDIIGAPPLGPQAEPLERWLVAGGIVTWERPGISFCRKHRIPLLMHPESLSEECVACWAESEKHKGCTVGPAKCLACYWDSTKDKAPSGTQAQA